MAGTEMAGKKKFSDSELQVLVDEVQRLLKAPQEHLTVSERDQEEVSKQCIPAQDFVVW